MQKLMKLNPVGFLILIAAVLLSIVAVPGASSASDGKPLSSDSAIKAGREGKYYYKENKKFIILKMSDSLKAYINKKDEKVYYYYNHAYYYWEKGIWFDSGSLDGMFSITPQGEVPSPLSEGPLLRVRKKKIPAGFAALKVPPKPVKKGMPEAATVHLYNLPLTLHGLVIYENGFDLNRTIKGGK